MANDWITEDEDDQSHGVEQTHFFDLIASVLVFGQFRQRVKERKSFHFGTSLGDCGKRPAGQIAPVFERSIDHLLTAQKDSIYMYRSQAVLHRHLTYFLQLFLF